MPLACCVCIVKLQGAFEGCRTNARIHTLYLLIAGFYYSIWQSRSASKHNCELHCSATCRPTPALLSGKLCRRQHMIYPISPSNNHTVVITEILCACATIGCEFFSARWLSGVHLLTGVHGEQPGFKPTFYVFFSYQRIAVYIELQYHE